MYSNHDVDHGEESKIQSDRLSGYPNDERPASRQCQAPPNLGNENRSILLVPMSGKSASSSFPAEASAGMMNQQVCNMDQYSLCACFEYTKQFSIKKLRHCGLQAGDVKDCLATEVRIFKELL